MTRFLPAAGLVLALAAAPPAARADTDAAERTVTRQVEVRPGDNLTRLATRHGVSVEELRRWNGTRIGKEDLIRAGDRLVIKVPAPPEAPPAGGPEWEGWYDIRPGDTLGGIAGRLGVTIEDLRRWNRLSTRSVIRAGDVLRYRQRGPRPEASSPGRPTDGRLVAAEHLGKGRGYRLRFPRGAFGLPRVNDTLRRCAARVAERFKGTADILVGDISRPTGGSFPPHVSHQSGRDADVGYYLSGNRQNATLHRVGAGELDYAKNWELLRCYLTTDRVVRVYMDASIQKAFARWLLKKGKATEATVARLFETHAPDPKAALVRHSAGHDTHVHVRFACDPRDAACEEEEDDAVFVLD